MIKIENPSRIALTVGLLGSMHAPAGKANVSVYLLAPSNFLKPNKACSIFSDINQTSTISSPIQRLRADLERGVACY